MHKNGERYIGDYEHENIEGSSNIVIEAYM